MGYICAIVGQPFAWIPVRDLRINSMQKQLKISLCHFSALVLVFAYVAIGYSSATAQTRKVDVCHHDELGYSKINISRNALQAHISHGDAEPQSPVPNQAGYEFDENCQLTLSQPNFEPFYIRNNNSSITPPWDSDMSIIENVEGDGFTAVTPRGGQKVGYGTSFFDTRSVTTLQTVNWDKISGKAGLVSYLNIWVTDGTNYAVIASENDYRNQDFAIRQEWKVFEYDTSVALDWLCASGAGARDGSQYLTCGGSRVTLADLGANIKILSPSFTVPPSYVGTGAPRAGYGFNLIFGDTQENFIGSYSLENISVTFGGVTYHPTN